VLSIILSCLLLIITPKHDDIPGWRHVLAPETIRSCSFGFTIVFSLEFVVRVMHQGFLLTPTAYLKSWWNRVGARNTPFRDTTILIHLNRSIVWYSSCVFPIPLRAVILTVEWGTGCCRQIYLS
jgi:hypothetical protein